MARCMTLAGVRPGMLVHNANTYGLFTGGHGFHQGAERIGAPVVPASGGCHGTPGDAPPRPRRSGARLDALVRARDRAGRAGRGDRPGDAEARARPVRRRALDGGAAREIERALPGLRAVNFYGLSEMCGPGVAAECLEVRDGLHVHEDHFLVEVVDPRVRRAARRGRRGRARLHDARKEAMPLLRYRTGDIGSVIFEPCRCGRTTARIRGLRGRRDDVIIVRGVNVYPSNVEHALLSVPEAAPHYQLVVERDRRDGRAHGPVRACRPGGGSREPAHGRRARAARAPRHPRSRRRAGARTGAPKRRQGRTRRRSTLAHRPPGPERAPRTTRGRTLRFRLRPVCAGPAPARGPASAASARRPVVGVP